MIHKTVTLTNEFGLHARPSAQLVTIASQYLSKITIVKDNKSINAKNIMDVMLLCATKGDTLEFIVEGTDEKEAIEAIEAIFVSQSMVIPA